MTDLVLPAPVTVTECESMFEKAPGLTRHTRHRGGSLAATTSTNERNQT